MRPLLVGTRGSSLALRQTEEVLQQLKTHHPHREFIVKTIRSGGDKSAEAPLDSLGLGIFVKEIEESLLRVEIDMAVHSLKDLTPQLPSGLTIGAVCQRLDARDVLIDKWSCGLADLPPGARIGTSSPRRTAQLKAHRPDVEALPIRGNVETRIRKALGGDYDGVLLAAAGVIRLGLEGKISQYLPAEVFVPAPGQGALAVELRQDDEEVASLVASIDHPPTQRAVTAERAFLERLGSGCQVPAAAYARVHGETLVMFAFLATPDGQKVFTTKAHGRASYPHEVALDAHQRLTEKGASIFMER